MPNFENGVASYVIGRATVENGFPVDFKGNADIACRHCKFYVRATQRCALNQEIVNYPEKYVGVNCPLERIEGNGI